jgi:N-methylhydantoinase A
MAKTLIGLHIGISFAEAALWQDQKLIATRRFYLPSEPIATHFGKFLLEHQARPDRVIVASRYLEKVLDSRLGGTVAQIVTAGFETWPILRQPVLTEQFTLQPYRQAPLASQDLIFGISARINCHGQELAPVRTEELENILVKFKSMSVKRVCVNLLFSQMNDSHQRQVADFFAAHSFEIFAAPRGPDSTDEMPAWRKNLINACLSGVFQEHFDEISKAVETAGGHRDSIHFINSNAEPFQNDPQQIASSLFGWSQAIARSLPQEDTAVLYMGLESFYTIESGNQQSLWKSPWGPIEAETCSHHRLSLQPTLEVINVPMGGIGLGEVELGYEPGPVCFGRGLRPVAIDLVHLRKSLELPQASKKNDPKTMNLLSTLIRNSPAMRDMTPVELREELIELVNARICAELVMKTNKKNIIMTGFFGKRPFEQFKSVVPDLNWHLDEFYEWRSVLSLQAIGERI